MPTKSPSSSNAALTAPTRPNRDVDLVRFVGSILGAARDQWGNGVVTEPNVRFNPLLLYTETHYALAAVLMYLVDGRDRAWLDVAAARLQIWNKGGLPVTFFHAMAVCLTALVVRRAGVSHAGVHAALDDLLARTREHRPAAYKTWCGNNAYLQQVAVDTVLLPLARGTRVTDDGLDCLAGEFGRYLTEEGFFYDLPREGTDQERLMPPTYIMKMLFLAGVCHELHPRADIARLFQSGIAAALPLLTRDGSFSYFGRTDNSPFAAGLTIFNLRKAASLEGADGRGFDAACAQAERYYRTFPRTAIGMLQSNRYGDARTPAEYGYSRDNYAYVGQYSLASCAYALLGCYWYAAGDSDAAACEPGAPPSVVVSNDLGVVRIRGGHHELIVRTGSQLTSWDRRYLGPTLLRYEAGGRLLVGAISRTVSTDRAVRTVRAQTPVRRVIELFADRYAKGIEQLDGASVGFLPVIRHGTADYLPHRAVSLDASPSSIRARYDMVRLSARGVRPCLIEAGELLHQHLPGLKPKEYSRPRLQPAPSFELSRDIDIDPARCRIADRLTGDLKGKTVLFAVRALPGVPVRVRGLTKRQSLTGWGSDGRQTIDIYEARPAGKELRYDCEIQVG